MFRENNTINNDASTFRNMLFDECVWLTFKDIITFENVLESSESILFEKMSGSKSGNLISYQGMFKD